MHDLVHGSDNGTEFEQSEELVDKTQLYVLRFKHPHDPGIRLGQKKKIGVVTVTRPTLFLGADPITFYCICKKTKK